MEGAAPPHLADLFARVLIVGVHRLLRRGLDRTYRPIVENTPTIRGRVLFDQMVKTNRTTAAMVCEFDELSHDTVQNQIIRSTLDRLTMDGELDPQLRARLRETAARMSDVTLRRVHLSDFRRIQLHRNIGHYDLLLKICELIHHWLLPDRSGTGYRFPDVLQDDAKMARVFQDFVRNFYAIEQNTYKSASERIYWNATSRRDEDLALLPSMLTDITLRSATRTIVVDTKWYREALQSYFGKEVNSLRPSLSVVLIFAKSRSRRTVA